MLRDISLHILDLVQNSTKAESTKVETGVMTKDDDKVLFVSISDNGKGMSKEFLERVEDPFTTGRTTRKVGMGIPFFKFACEQAGGNFRIDSTEGEGTELQGTMEAANIDRLPLGNMGDTVKMTIMSAPGTRFIFKFASSKGEFIFDTDEVKAQIDDIPIDSSDILMWIEEFVNENVLEIFGGVLNEVS